MIGILAAAAITATCGPIPCGINRAEVLIDRLPSNSAINGMDIPKTITVTPEQYNQENWGQYISAATQDVIPLQTQGGGPEYTTKPSGTRPATTARPNAPPTASRNKPLVPR